MKLPRFVSFAKRRPSTANKTRWSLLSCHNLSMINDFLSPLPLSTAHHHHHHHHNPSMELHHYDRDHEEVRVDLNLPIGLSSPHHNEEVKYNPSIDLASSHPRPPAGEHEDGVEFMGGVEELKRAFHRFDVDGDGRISAEELRSVLCSLGDQTTPEEASLLVRNLDKDGDGFIGLDDFILINIPTTHHLDIINHDHLDDKHDYDDDDDEMKQNADEEMVSVFRTFDIDGNGYIDGEELYCVLCCLADDESKQECSVARCQEMIKQVDRNGDGVVDFHEFKEMMAISF